MKKLETSTEKLIQDLNEKGGITTILLNHLNISDFNMEESLLILLNYGWYIPSQFRIKKLSEVITLIESENINTAENIIIKFFKENIKDLEESLTIRHNDRRNIIKEAFQAHEKKMFYSSTILFLSQADGITNSKLFRKNLNFENNQSSIKILEKESPLNVDTRKTENPSYFSELNRHGVMHGLSKDFGIEKNSFKSLSLLCFISDWHNRNK